MSEAKYTGKLQRKPWSAVVLHGWGNCVQSRDGYVAWKLTAEDANLIAAAPELLEACKAFVTAWEKCLQLEKTDVALRLVKDAIAKAGRS